MKLAVQKRDVFGKKLKNMRVERTIPAVVYGKHLSENMNISFTKIDFLRLYKQAGETTPITLEGEGINELVMIHDVNVHPISNELQHVDFLAVKADEKTTAEVPVVLVGESEIEAKKVGKIEQVKDHVKVEALPANLPSELSVDKAIIKKENDVIFVKNITLPSGVEFVGDTDLAIATVSVIEAEETEETDAE